MSAIVFFVYALRSMSSRLAAIVVAAVLAFAALALCNYSFGKGDQLQYLVEVVAVQDPGALGDDAYLRAFDALRSFFWRTIAAVTTEDSLPAACLALALIAAGAAALVLMRLGTRLTGDQRGIDLLAGTAAALVFVVPKEDNWFGIVSLSDVELTATSAVIPLVVASILAWADARRVLALILGIATALLHAQTAAYLMTAWVLMAFIDAGRDPKRLVLPVIIGLGGLAAVIRERATNAVAEDALLAFETAGLAMYKELVDPRYATLSAWLAVAAILIIGALAAAALRREPGGWTIAQRRVVLWTACSLAFPLAGLALLSLGARDPLLWRLMVGRSFMLPQIGALVIFATWVVVALRTGGWRGLRAALALIFVSIWPFPDWPHVAAGGGLLFVMAMIAADAIPARAAAPALRWVPFTAVLVTGLGIVRFVHRPHPWLDDGVDVAWRDVQQWARDNTEAGTMFVTPPYRAGWRVRAHRPTYVEMNDGGLFFYAAQEAAAWTERLAQLGFEPRWRMRPEFGSPIYADALAAIEPDWFAESGIEYVVTETDRDVPLGEVVWESGAFTVRRVGPPARPGQGNDNE